MSEGRKKESFSLGYLFYLNDSFFVFEEKEVPLCWNHLLFVYQNELGADQERICINLSFHFSMKTPHSACTLSLNVQIQLCRRMWNCKENLAADLERNTLWTLFHIRAFQWNFSSHAFWQSRKFTEAKVLHHEFFNRGLLKIFFPEFLSHTRDEKRKQDFHWEICPEEKANSPRRAPGKVWTASEVELTPSASLQQNVVRWILYTILNTLQYNTWLNFP